MNEECMRALASWERQVAIPQLGRYDYYCLLIWPFVFSAVCVYVIEESMQLDSQENHLVLLAAE